MKTKFRDESHKLKAKPEDSKSYVEYCIGYPLRYVDKPLKANEKNHFMTREVKKVTNKYTEVWTDKSRDLTEKIPFRK
jgi:hypothetical protein